MNKSNTKANIGISIFLFLLATILLVISFWRQAEIGRKASDFPDYEAYKSLDKKFILVKDNNSYVTIDYKKIGEVKKLLLVKGKFRRAYIFINASVDNGKPLTVYDSIYILLNYRGGHILRSQSLSVPASDTTQLLYDLRKIPNISGLPYSETKQPQYTDWLSEINSKKEIPFYTFLSSWRPGGLIKEISLAYECEENGNCSITLLKKKGSEVK